MRATIHYFDLAAATYGKRTSVGLWKWFKKWESSAVKRVLPNLKRKTAIEYGAGAGYYTALLLEAGATQVTAVELSSKMAQTLKESLSSYQERVRVEIQDWVDHRATAQIDFAFSFGALEFVSRPEAAFRAMRQSISPEGKAVLMVPRPTWMGRIYRYLHSRKGLQVLLFSDPELLQLAQATGWSAEILGRAGLWNTLVELRPTGFQVGRSG